MIKEIYESLSNSRLKEAAYRFLKHFGRGKLYLHSKSNKMYELLSEGLFQNEKGEWVKCKIYSNMKGMTFVRLEKDFNENFKLKDE